MRARSVMTSIGDRARPQRLVAQDLVEVERDALAVADRVDDHQRLAAAELHDVAGGEEVRVAEPPERGRP